jgi:hypothetical protein
MLFLCWIEGSLGGLSTPRGAGSHVMDVNECQGTNSFESQGIPLTAFCHRCGLSRFEMWIGIPKFLR